MPTFSERGGHWGFAATSDQHREGYVVVDGQSHGPFPHLGHFGMVAFSEDGSLWAERFGSEAEMYALINGTKQGPYSADEVEFSSDSSRWGYLGITMNDAKRWIFTNRGTIGPLEGEPVFYGFAPGTSTPVYSAEDEQLGQPDSVFLHFGERRVGPFREVGEVVFSERGGAWGFEALKHASGRQPYLVVNGQEFGSYPMPDVYSDGGMGLRFAPDGRSWVRRLRHQSKWRVIKNGRQYRLDHEGVGTPAFSTRGRKLGLRVQKYKPAHTTIPDYYAWVDGAERGPFVAASEMLTLADGRLQLWGVRPKPRAEGQWEIVRVTAPAEE